MDCFIPQTKHHFSEHHKDCSKITANIVSEHLLPICRSACTLRTT
uniref:Uncharacterized protein n=1 Tax=Arundo donax TaxID=35708 RepID=A0A0A9EM69_ARUDO